MNLAYLRVALNDVLEHGRISTLFQPIMGMGDASIYGYEALSRGPSDSPLHSPVALLRAADHAGLSAEVEQLCFEAALQNFAERKLSGKLFANVRPGRLLEPYFQPASLSAVLKAYGIAPQNLILELTESDPVEDYAQLAAASEALRRIGLKVAMDDLGEGFSSLRLWSEMKPAYVKLDKHFISGLNQDPVKLQFVRSMQEIAENANAQIVAEGVETASELAIVKDLGVAFVQGYLIGRPLAMPSAVPSPDVVRSLGRAEISVFPSVAGSRPRQPCARTLLIEAPAVSPSTPSEQVLELLQKHQGLHAVAVVERGLPVGMVTRPFLLDRFTRIYTRELYGKKPCSAFMEKAPLVVDIGTLIADLSELVVKKGKQTFTDGFIITENGQYRGMGSGYDLMRAITEMQVVAARYANPLTLLPGNVPIHEHTDRLLAAGAEFVAAYFDLDHFKPFNDVYGYRKGDAVIQLLGRILSQECDPSLDFLGHVGGDDFIILFQSRDWEARCQRILARFDAERAALFQFEHLAEGGYFSENRRGKMVFHPLVSLSIGAVPVSQTGYSQRQEVERAAAEAKKMAKKEDGSSLFVERRQAGQQADAEPAPASRDWAEVA
ncbi:diguanylate cyclase/phosphodiesterase [Sulfuritortus calidifontis]|uniref:Diguanylate cyclase/phosphodiesterase n=1 Tax=Sulfuritortus calidifontis TaxID=1914471 RepID=A0A4R3JZ77_9PROT|nr:GGDEF domain-containing protein [Sulfuritortus calidifontis]TCS73051.1 diguanylate cyclase/phosphodiesterase [Sulfuritortus calidifontis]